MSPLQAGHAVPAIGTVVSRSTGSGTMEGFPTDRLSSNPARRVEGWGRVTHHRDIRHLPDALATVPGCCDEGLVVVLRFFESRGEAHGLVDANHGWTGPARGGTWKRRRPMAGAGSWGALLSTRLGVSGPRVGDVLFDMLSRHVTRYSARAARFLVAARMRSTLASSRGPRGGSLRCGSTFG